MGWREWFRVAAAVVVVLFGVLSPLASKSVIATYGPSVAIVALGVVLVWLEVDLHTARGAQVVDANHFAEIKELVLGMRLGGFASPQTLKGIDNTKGRVLFESHFGRAKKLLATWRSKEAAEDKERAACRTKCRSLAAGLGLGGDEQALASLFCNIAWTYATGPGGTAQIKWAWDVRDDGSVHVPLQGQDCMVAAHGGHATAQRLSTLFAGIPEWRETRKWRRAYEQNRNAKDRFMHDVEVISESSVVRGKCHYCWYG